MCSSTALTDKHVGVFSTVGENVHLKLEITNFFRKKPNNLNFQSPYFYVYNQKWIISISILDTGVNLTFSGEIDQKGSFTFTISTLGSNDKLYSPRAQTIEYKPGKFEKTFIYTFFNTSCHALKNSEYDNNGSLIFSLQFHHNVKILLQAPDTFHLLQDSSSQTSSTETLETLSNQFKELFVSGNHADVIFKVEEKEFKAHRSVLAARSPVLDSMFSHEMQESSSGVVNISDCNKETFEDFLLYLYSGRSDRISPSNAVELYQIADKYDLKELKQECCKVLITNISVDIVCDVLRLCLVHNEKCLLEAATSFFVHNFRPILVTAKWKEFLKDHPESGNELFLKFADMQCGKV